jgi:hypothetical protein
MQIWKGDQKTDSRIIAFFKGTIYKANPKPGDVDDYIFQLKTNTIPTSRAIEIPPHYIRQITMQEGKNYIEVHFGVESTEHLIINDSERKKEVFNYLKANLPGESGVVAYSKFDAAKKPLIALGVVTAIFLWVLFVATGIEKGDETVIADDGHSAGGIVLVLANLGVTNITLIFAALALIAVIAAIRKARNPPMIHYLVVRK